MTAPVSFVTVYGQFDGDAIFEDPNGLARVPLRAIGVLSHSAQVSRSGRATFDGRTYDRDTLAAVRRDWENDDLLKLDPCGHSGCDQAGPFTTGRIPACHNHAKDSR